MPTISASWKQLAPRKKSSGYDPSDETEEEYVTRLAPHFSIPLEVAEQWLYPLYKNEHTISNYAWMDYRKLKFEPVDLPGAIIAELRVIEAFSSFVRERSTSRGHSDLTCINQDSDFWKLHGTWRVPPVVLDVESIGPIPSHADIKGPYQLIEGHSRLGNFFALGHANRPKAMHRVYLLRKVG